MARINAVVNAFNRGIVSDLALARTDIERLALSASVQKNWMPRTLGSMMLRPGLEYILTSKDDLPAVHIPFIFSTTDTAILEITNQNMRVIVDDVALTRSPISTTIANGTFTTDLTGWTDNDGGGSTSQWATGGYLSMQGTSSTQARRTQALTIAGGDQGAVHSITVVITRGVASIRVGSTSGDGDYLSATFLGEGTHSLAFIPTSGTAYLDISCQTEYTTLIDSVSMEASGELNVSAPWATADLSKLRWAQSGDVVYVDCADVHPYKIERRANNSWSIVKYLPEDGPFRSVNGSQVTLSPSAISGDITVTASGNLFEDGHIGALFYHDSVGQLVEESISAEDTFSDPIRVTGVDAFRRFSVVRSGTWTGTVTLQRSVGDVGAWTDVTTYSGNGSSNYDDGLDNSIIYYRIGIKSGDYGSGTADVSLVYSSGSITGIFRITAVASPTSASAIVLRNLGGTNATKDWGEGSWSAYRGYPSAVAIYEGRVWHAGKGNIYGSVSDQYETFDQDFLGDAGPLNRSIGYGPVDSINWMLAIQRLILGTDGAEISARSTSFDEPLTPTNFNLKSASTQGSANIQPVIVDKKGIYLQRGGTRVYELAFDQQDFDYQSSDLTVLSPQIGEPGIVKMVVQRQPDTRIHCIRSDGTVALLVFDRAESVICWIDIETAGQVEDAVVLPGAIEDDVYYQVKRTVNSSDKRYLEKFAYESECTGLPVAKLSDSFKYYDSLTGSSESVFSEDSFDASSFDSGSFQLTGGGATTIITGLEHLEGLSVVVWGWNTDAPFTDTYGNTIGKNLGAYTVSSGQITLSAEVTNACIGLPYTAQYRSTKLAYGARAGTALAQKKKVSQLAVILKNTHVSGLKFGKDFNSLRSMGLNFKGKSVSSDSILVDGDLDAFSFNSEYDTDSRICLQAQSPTPATVLACIVGVEVHEKV